MANEITTTGNSENNELTCDICVVGAGPVGLTAAMLLAAAGRNVIVLESRGPAEQPNAKSNHISARTMEIFRQLGVAEKVRAAGLPDDFPTDAVFATRLSGKEIMRFRMPSRRERFNDRNKGYTDGDLPSAERPVRLSQMYLQPILFRHAASMDGITILGETSYVGHTQTSRQVMVQTAGPDGDRPLRIRCAYLIGADGARSTVRKRIGAKLAGLDNLLRARAALVRSPDLLERFRFQPGWMNWFPVGAAWAAIIAVDGKELWRFYWHYFPGDPAYDAFDVDVGVRDILGDGLPLAYEVEHLYDWTGKRLTADYIQDGRVFLCGDSAHQWVPFGGYGMNAGIADAHNLAWMFNGVFDGWASASLPDNYPVERMPVTYKVAGFTAKAVDVLQGIRPELIDRDDNAGTEARQEVGKRIYDANLAAIMPTGLNFGYCYEESLIIAHDGATPPQFTMGSYEPSIVPGCRLPHFDLDDGRSLYDAAGRGFALLRLDPTIDVAPLVDAARAVGLPLTLLDIGGSAELDPSVYTTPLVLARPDQHVAWRGHAVPADPAALIDLLRGKAAESA